jgi:poly-gamma-glutamate synthesis protein (capsule biosynthesis protein)
MLAGDLMLGRGMDQIQRAPGDPEIHERRMHDARHYVRLAERRCGPIPRHAPPAYVWGDALALIADHRPDLRIVNLETAITARGAPAPKGINYRMSPENIDVLRAGAIDVCALANNHVLDWGMDGLSDTLDALDHVGIGRVGAGRSAAEADAPLIRTIPGRGRLVVFALADPSSGVPVRWGAGPARPGVALLDDRGAAIARIARTMREIRRPGDVVLASVHWGPNWSFVIDEDDRAFAHALIDEAGVDVVHGHSSHHPKAIEAHGGGLILYGCGDLLNDYEGIGGIDAAEGGLALVYMVRVGAGSGVAALDMLPFRILGFRLIRAEAEDRKRLLSQLDRACARLGAGVTEEVHGVLRFVPN